MGKKCVSGCNAVPFPEQVSVVVVFVEIFGALLTWRKYGQVGGALDLVRVPPPALLTVRTDRQPQHRQTASAQGNFSCTKSGLGI